MMDSKSTLARIEHLAAIGQISSAEQECDQLLNIDAHQPQAWAWRSLFCAARADWCGAEQAARRALTLDAANPEYLCFLSDALLRQGRSDEAELCARQAVIADPELSGAWSRLGAALAHQRRMAEAASAYREATVRDPLHHENWRQLGTTELEAGRLAEAQAAYEHCLYSSPDDPAARIGHSLVLSQSGRLPEALEGLRGVVRRAPHLAVAWMYLCQVLKMAGQSSEAEDAAHRALDLDPHQPESQIYLIDLFLKRSAFTGAEELARRLLAQHADLVDGWALLGMALWKQGEHSEGLQALARAIQLQPAPTYHSVYLLGLQYSDGVSADQLLPAHQEWDEFYAKPVLSAPAGLARSVSRGKLRLGFVSADFHNHPISFLALPAMEQLDKQLCSIVCYSDVTREDGFTQRFKSISDLWRMTAGVSEEAIARQVQEDDVDALFDLAGHAGNRLLVFARKPAPIQISWLGYVGTTGLQAMDFLQADGHHVLPGEERFYSESILRMPHDYACYEPPVFAPPVCDLPMHKAGYFTFGCFNNPAKFSRSIFHLWGEILARVPRARLLLQYYGLEDAVLRERIRARFREQGGDAQRLDFVGGRTQLEMLAAYQHVDLALDTQPYSGGVTTCEALWMGVPVITCRGRTFASRHATSHLTNAGFADFIADDSHSYVELAVAWASEPEKLRSLRFRSRETMQASPLCDARRFAADWLTLLEQAWQAR